MKLNINQEGNTMTETSQIKAGDIIEYRRDGGLSVMEVREVEIWEDLLCVQLTGHINTNDFGAEIAKYGEQARDTDKVILAISDEVNVTHHFPIEGN